jgi:hypothetical protein
VLIARLAINTKYARYSPGGILISSTLNFIIEQNKLRNLDICILDLAQSDHKDRTYKIAYGGEQYYHYNFFE